MTLRQFLKNHCADSDFPYSLADNLVFRTDEADTLMYRLDDDDSEIGLDEAVFLVLVYDSASGLENVELPLDAEMTKLSEGSYRVANVDFLKIGRITFLDF